jgi:signal transduction histidine kinase
MTALASVSPEDRADLPGGTESRFLRLGFELTAFLLIVATFAAVLLKDLVIDREFGIGPATLSRYGRYWYADNSGSGTSTIAGDPSDPLQWRCRLTSVFANPYCGAGILIDVSHRGVGRDLSKLEKVKLDLDYQGPAKYLKLTLKNWGAAYADAAHGDSTKPNVIEFPVHPGHNQVTLNLRDAAIEQWWINLHPYREAGRPELDNVVAVDLQTGTGAPPGDYAIKLNRLAVSGRAITPEHWYLLLLGLWTGFTALYLVHRVRRMRAEHAQRQRLLVAESLLLQQARDAAESASHAKSRFLAHMSHELRTPLNAILGYAQVLRAAELSNRQNVAARTIQQSGEHLLALISDILDLSRIEAGKLELDRRSVALRAIVRGVADMIAVRAQEKSLAFHWHVAPDVPHCVIADDKALRQILLNLLGNAVKFTATGKVGLSVTRMSEKGDRVALRFEVRDTGPGIPPEKLDLIFQPFEQADDAARHAGGTGLGLSISRRLVELMDGQLLVESVPGEGSAFRFEISVPIGDQMALRANVANDRGRAIPALSEPGR